jgi:hypothetical protein
MSSHDEWWRAPDVREIFRGESDGQSFTAVFVRDFAGKKEYAIVRCSDGDYLDYVYGGFTIRGDAVTPIDAD